MNLPVPNTSRIRSNTHCLWEWIGVGPEPSWAASWAYSLLMVTVYGRMRVPMRVYGDGRTAVPAVRYWSARLGQHACVVRGSADTWSVGTWHQAMQIKQGTDLAVMHAAFQEIDAAQAVAVTTSLPPVHFGKLKWYQQTTQPQMTPSEPVADLVATAEMS